MNLATHNEKNTYEHDERVAAVERRIRARSGITFSQLGPADRSLLIELLCNNTQRYHLYDAISLPALANYYLVSRI